MRGKCSLCIKDEKRTKHSAKSQLIRWLTVCNERFLELQELPGHRACSVMKQLSSVLRGNANRLCYQLTDKVTNTLLFSLLSLVIVFILIIYLCFKIYFGNSCVILSYSYGRLCIFFLSFFIYRCRLFWSEWVEIYKLKWCECNWFRDYERENKIETKK